MHETTITITKKYPPDEGKKMWKLLTQSGEKYLVAASEHAFYREGETCTVGYTSSEFQGKTYHTVMGAPRGQTSGVGRPGGSIVQHPGQGISPKTNGGDPEYDLKVGAQAKFNAVAPPLAARA